MHREAKEFAQGDTAGEQCSQELIPSRQILESKLLTIMQSC